MPMYETAAKMMEDIWAEIQEVGNGYGVLTLANLGHFGRKTSQCSQVPAKLLLFVNSLPMSSL